MPANLSVPPKEVNTESCQSRDIVYLIGVTTRKTLHAPRIAALVALSSLGWTHVATTTDRSPPLLHCFPFLRDRGKSLVRRAPVFQGTESLHGEIELSKIQKLEKG